MKFALTTAILFAFAASKMLSAQTTPSPEEQAAPYEALAAADLPDAPNARSVLPGASSSAGAEAARTSSPSSVRIAPYHPPQVAPVYHKYVEPGQTALPLASADKVLFGLHQLMSPYLLLTIAAAAGYEQAVNGSPNYGTNFGAYGQRMGAGAIRDASQTIFSDSVMATILHEDPRYYVMGNRRSGFVRAAYAVSRVFVTQSDDGAATPNYSLFSGYAGAAALENAYYPDDNHGFTETAKSFGGSIGGAALSNVVREFLPDILRAARLEK
jgi:hypothetical protein